MWITLALATSAADAQTIGVFVGPELILPLGPARGPGIGFQARVTVAASSYGPEVGGFTDLKYYGDREFELGGGASAGLGLVVHQYCIAHAPYAIAGVRSGFAYNARWGPLIRVGADLRVVVFEGALERSLLLTHRADVAPTWGLGTATGALQIPLGVCVPLSPLGRALRVPGGVAVPQILTRAPHGLGRACRRWLRQAQGERASVDAFARMARELDAVGAPRSLAARAPGRGRRGRPRRGLPRPRPRSRW